MTGSSYRATLLKPITRPFGKYPTDTLPKNGILKDASTDQLIDKTSHRLTDGVRRANKCRCFSRSPYYRIARRKWHHQQRLEPIARILW